MNDPATVDGYQRAFDTLCDKRLAQSMYGECDILMQDVLLTLHGDDHTVRRALEMQLFKRDFIRYYEREVYPITLAATLNPYLIKGKMDLVEFGGRVNINLSADLAGIDRDPDSADELDMLLSISKKFSEGATLFHSTRNKDEVRLEVEETLSLFQEKFLTPSWKRREALLSSVEKNPESELNLPRDVLTVLLANRDKHDLDDQMIFREVAFFLQAATHSSANALVHIFNEIYNWSKGDPENRVKIRNDPFFLQRCVHEGLRLHPASPVAWRTSTCPFQLLSGKQVENGDSVVVDLQTSNQDESIFGSNPKEFNPYREVSGKVPSFGLTFGVGVHTCFGRDLAGGSLPGRSLDPDKHYFGTLTNLMRSLLSHDIRPDPDNAPIADDTTVRNNWSSYPVLIGKGESN